MTKEEYLKYGEKYLNLKTIKEQVDFDIFIQKKFPVAKFRIFQKWMNDVGHHQSHKSSMQSNDFHLKRLEVKLSPKKNISTDKNNVSKKNIISKKSTPVKNVAGNINFTKGILKKISDEYYDLTLINNNKTVYKATIPKKEAVKMNDKYRNIVIN